jgi:outer membrane lipoprotein carrier protein
MPTTRSALRSFAAGAAALTAAALVAPTLAHALDRDQIVEGVRKKYTDVTSLKASFTQTTKSAVFGDETVSGDLVVKRPGMMRWAFGEEKQFITNGQKMWIYTAADKQVIVYDDISSQRSAADSLLTSMDKLDEQFSIAVLSSTDAAHSLELKPKVADGQFKVVRLTLDGAFLPVRVEIVDSFDNVTELSFSNVVLNVSAPDSLFTFTAPAGVTVVSGSMN